MRGEHGVAHARRDAGGGRIEEQRGFVHVVPGEQLAQPQFHVADEIFLLLRRPRARTLDGGCVDFDADELWKQIGERLCKKARARVGVDEQRLVALHERTDEFDHRVRDFGVGLREERGKARFAERVVAVARVPRPQPAKRLVHLRRCKRALFDLDNAVATLAVVSDGPLRHMDTDAVAIAERFWRGDDRAHRDGAEMSNALECVGDLSAFDFELVRIVDVLVGAAAAFSKVRAGCGDAMRRCFPHGNQCSLGKLFFPPPDARDDLLAGNRERHKHNASVMPRDTVASEGDILDG